MEAEAAREDFAVIGQHLIGDAVGPKRCSEDITHRPCGRSSHQAGGHTEAAVVVDPGNDLEPADVVQQHPGQDVHLT